MHRHGKYLRSAVTSRRVYRIPVYRWRCARCGVTTSVLPDFLAPYAQFISVLREGTVRRHLRGWAVSAIAARACTVAASGLSVRTVIRWLARIRACAKGWTEALSEQLLRLQPGWDLFSRRWEGPSTLVSALCDLGDAFRSLVPAHQRHPGVYAFCNGLLPDLPRL